MTETKDDIREILDTIHNSIQELNDKIKKLEEEYIASKENKSELSKQFLIDDKQEVNDYLLKHYLVDCDLDEKMTVEKYKQIGFCFTEDEIKAAMEKYEETPQL